MKEETHEEIIALLVHEEDQLESLLYREDDAERVKLKRQLKEVKKALQRASYGLRYRGVELTPEGTIKFEEKYNIPIVGY